MKNIWEILYALLFFVFSTLGIQTAHASELNFSVNPVLPTNQLDSKVGYYDLLLDPGQKQNLTVELSNQTDKVVTVDVSVASATSNIGGVVEYSPNAIKPDTSLKYNMKDLAKTPEKVELPAKSKKNIQIDVVMPKDSFDGVVAGGVTLKQDAKELEAKASDSKGLSIKNQYQFVIALLMQQNKTAVAPRLQMNTVEPAQVNSRNVINANFQNTAMGYLKGMDIDARVTAKGQGEVLYDVQKENMSMAPNTNFNFPLSLEGERFKSGTYTYSAEVYGKKDAKGKYIFGKDSNGEPQHYAYRWNFSQDFIVKGSKASELNKKNSDGTPL